MTGSIIDGGHPYKTRILVRRPIDPRKFEGTVFVEWSKRHQQHRLRQRLAPGLPPRALRRVQRYASDLQRLEAGGHLLPSIADDLLNDAAALLSDIEAE
jgi:hypothetical protein